MILDTSFLIDYMEGNRSAKEKLEQLKSEGEITILTPINSYELQRGAEKYYKTENEVEKINQLIDQLKAKKTNMEWKEGKEAARIESNLEDSGNKIELTDQMIAAIAREQGEIILTGNPEHFERIEGVEVESY